MEVNTKVAEVNNMSVDIFFSISKDIDAIGQMHSS